MTQTTTHLPNGDKGVLLSPEHRLLIRIALHPGPSYFPAQRGASVTQLRALERNSFAVLVRSGFQVLGVRHLTERGVEHLHLLNAALTRQQTIAALAAGEPVQDYCGDPCDPQCGPDNGQPWCRYHGFGE